MQAQREIEAPVSAGDRMQPVPWQDARLLAEVLEHVRQEYVEKISDEELIEAAIRGMIADLDAHSAFLDPEEFDEIRISTTGEYSGVGIEVALENGVVKVVNPIEGTPAQKAGVLAGDTILAVDDVPVSVENLNDTIDRMRGKAGTPVKISIARAPIRSRWNSRWLVPPCRCTASATSCSRPASAMCGSRTSAKPPRRTWKRSLAKLKKKNGAALSGLVLDLRNNPGGVLEAAVGVSDVFLDDGVIVTANGRAADARFEMDAQPRRRAQRRADRRAGERRLGLRVGDRRRRFAGSSSRDAARPPDLRQGLGADRGAAVRWSCHQAHDFEVLHSVRRVHS